jgi:hypothetical protein
VPARAARDGRGGNNAARPITGRGTYTDAEPANTVGFSCASIAAALVPDTLKTTRSDGSEAPDVTRSIATR